MSNYIFPKNFPCKEFLNSARADQLGIVNKPPTKEISANINRIAYWMQELRNRLSQHYGRDIPLVISSGYRIEALNSAVGGARRSAHCYGLAVDFKASGLTTKEICLFIFEHCEDMPFDQCIDSYGRFVHIGIEKPNTGERRGHFLMPYKVAGKTHYANLSYIPEIDEL